MRKPWFDIGKSSSRRRLWLAMGQDCAWFGVMSVFTVQWWSWRRWWVGCNLPMLFFGFGPLQKEGDASRPSWEFSLDGQYDVWTDRPSLIGFYCLWNDTQLFYLPIGRSE